MTDEAEPVQSVFVVQLIVPHYRLGVFGHLCACDDPRFTILTGDRAVDGVQAMSGQALDGIRHRIAGVRLFSVGPLKFTWQPDAWRIVRQERPDVVIVHGGFYDLTSWALLLWARMRGRTVLSWTIGLQRPERGPKLWLRLLFYRLAKGLLVYGDYPARLLADAGIDRKRMHVIYNSLDVSAQREAEEMVADGDLARLRKDLSLGPESRVLVFIGRIVPRKRLSIAVEAMKLLAGSGMDVRLVLIGDGDDTNTLRDLSRSLGLEDRIHFVGAVYDERRIAGYMRLADAAIVPEAGLPIIHPMGYGVPPVISDNVHRHGTEWEAVEEGHTGYFYRDGDAADLAATIRGALEDETGRAAIARNCRDRVRERYTAQGHAARIVEGTRKFGQLPDRGACSREGDGGDEARSTRL